MDTDDMPSEDDVSRDAADDFKQVHDVIIVGAGAAGIGVAISVAHSGVENFLIVDREGVGGIIRSMACRNEVYHPIIPEQFSRYAGSEFSGYWRISSIQYED